MRISRGCISLIIVILFLSLSCTTVPITGRKQFIILPDYAMLSMSLQQYNEFLKTNKISSNQEQTQMVKKVGRKIQMAVEQYFTDKNMSYTLRDYKWEFNLIESEEKNAWAMPGGKVVVYEGLLPITRDEAGLAVVMGHEIAHAIAKHGNERMSQGLIVQMGGMALTKAMAEKPEKTRRLWMTAFGVGAQFGVMLPFSRYQESEADHLGLVFMAKAGYDPNEAVEVWKRMAQMKEGQTPPEFLSTHPSDETRIRKIKETIPKVEQYL
ncbi:MAG: M48 family metallopeptidase [Candidatus Scalindua sp.]|nr:M48 family metallopeptidase [Candidatus Scalindua sp.]